MGQVKVKYNSTRGEHTEGSEVEDPKDWLLTLLEDNYEETRSKF